MQLVLLFCGTGSKFNLLPLCKPKFSFKLSPKNLDSWLRMSSPSATSQASIVEELLVPMEAREVADLARRMVGTGRVRWARLVRGDTYMTSEIFSHVLTPFPCPHLVMNYMH